ncbi:SDR family NAD(P)-dependent oxidoreductase, partial [Inquilinus sp.]|uniref:SDR family NAD(P)-dependent oxidoreductase n=1 Tax=Inquilinus sp. TaxID=1932117 RepID=UPI0031DDBC79
MQRFQGKVAIVTGAGSGIGEATARRLSEEGAAVMLVDREEERVRRVADSLPADRTLARAVDVSRSEAVDGMVAAA